MGCLEARPVRGLGVWDASAGDVVAVMTVVACRAAAEAFGPLVSPELRALLGLPWRIATGEA